MSFSSLKLVYEPFSPLHGFPSARRSPTHPRLMPRKRSRTLFAFSANCARCFRRERRNWIFFAASLLIYFRTKKAIQNAKGCASLSAPARLGGCSLNRVEPFSCVHPRALWGKAEALIRSEALSKDFERKSPERASRLLRMRRNLVALSLHTLKWCFEKCVPWTNTNYEPAEAPTINPLSRSECKH